MNKVEEFIYFKYLINSLVLKHNFEIIDQNKNGWEKGRGKSDIEIHNISIKYHWKDLKIRTFDELVNSQNFYNYKHYKSIYINEFTNN